MNQAVKQTERADRLLNWAVGVSIALLGLSSAVMSIAGLAGFPLPDWLIRVLGVVSLLSLPVLVYSVIKKARSAKMSPQAQKKTAPAERKPNLGAAAAPAKKKKKRRK